MTKKGFLLIELCCSLAIFGTFLYSIIKHHGSVLLLQKRIATNNSNVLKLHSLIHEHNKDSLEEVALRYTWLGKSVIIKHSIKKLSNE